MLSRIKKVLFCSGTSHAYLSRWAIPLPFGFAVYVHRFHESDVAVFHDHPWSFVSIVLWGGYREHLHSGRKGFDVVMRLPGSVVFRRAEDLHYVTLLKDSGAWSLVLRGRRRREWGFLTDHGWKRWDLYLRERYGVRSSEVVR